MTGLPAQAGQMLGSIAAGIVVLAAVAVAAYVIRRVIHRTLARRLVKPDMAQVIERAVYVALIGLGLFMAISVVFGQSGTALTGILVTAFITGIGLQDLLRNYVAGLYLLLERNFVAGSRVRGSDFTGVITEVKLRTTTVLGDDGHVIIVPNNDLFNRTVEVVETLAGASVEGAENDADEGVQVRPDQV